MTQLRQKKPGFTASTVRQPIYLKTTNFNADTHTKRESLRALHDPHLQHVHFHTEKSVRLMKKNKEIPEDDKVKCTAGENKTHQRYLRKKRKFTDTEITEIERAKMKHFLEQQQEGQEMTLAELREQMLDEYVENLRQALKAERTRLKATDLQDETIEMEVLRGKAEKRKRLRIVQAEVQHEYNKEKLLKEEKERRQRQNYNAEQHWAAVQKQRLLELVKRSDQSALDEITKKRNPPCRSNITTKNPDASPAAEQRPRKVQFKEPEAKPAVGRRLRIIQI